MGASSAIATNAHPRKDLPITFEPYFLSKEENDERIKRLSKKILECIYAYKREKRKEKSSKSNFRKLFGESFAEIE